MTNKTDHELAIDRLLAAGNHAANCKEDDWPGYQLNGLTREQQCESAMHYLGETKEYDMWCCWSAIMQERDNLAALPPDTRIAELEARIKAYESACDSANLRAEGWEQTADERGDLLCRARRGDETWVGDFDAMSNGADGPLRIRIARLAEELNSIINVDLTSLISLRKTLRETNKGLRKQISDLESQLAAARRIIEGKLKYLSIEEAAECPGPLDCSLSYTVMIEDKKRLEALVLALLSQVATMRAELLRAAKIIQWMAPSIGRMCPPNGGIAELNEHWLYMEALASLGPDPKDEKS